jgi:hypothetical protein
MASDEQMQELLDKQALHDNLMYYCRGIDRMDHALIQSTYWPDSTDDHGAFVGAGQAWADEAVRWKDLNRSINHHVSNVLSEIDGNFARRESMFNCVVTFREPVVTMFLGGRYRDLCEKRNGEWKILHRVCVWDWCEQRPTEPGWPLVAQPEMTNWGRFFPDDPIYKDWTISEPTRPPQ